MLLKTKESSGSFFFSLTSVMYKEMLFTFTMYKWILLAVPDTLRHLDHRDRLFRLLLSVSCRFHLTEPESGSFQLALGSAYTGSSISPGGAQIPFQVEHLICRAVV